MKKTRSTKPASPEAEVMAEAGESQTYVVTDRAPMKVAGRRVTPGLELVLTIDEARFELLQGHISAKLAEAPSSKD